MKSKIAAFSFLAVLSFLLTACSVQEIPYIGEPINKIIGSIKKTTSPVTINMWGLWEDPMVMNQLIAKYQETHPNVTVQYDDRSVLKPLVTYKERVFARLKETGGPDILRVHNTWVPSITDTLAPMPSKYMTADDYRQTFYPVASDSAVSGGRIYAMPVYYDGLVLVYNKSHFQSVDQAEAPTAWEEFRRLALSLTIKAEDQIVRAGAAMGEASNIEHFSDILGLMFAQAGVTVPDQLDTMEAQHALLFYTNFVKADGVWNKSFPEATTAFANGQVSMIFVPSWRILDILNAAPDLDIGVAPVPQALVDTPASWGTFWMDVVSNQSPNAEVAWDFLNFLAEEEQQLFLYNEYTKTRPFGPAFSRLSLRSELTSNQYLKPVLDTAPFAQSAEIAARAGNRRQEDALYEAVESVLNDTKPVDQALSDAKKTIAQ